MVLLHFEFDYQGMWTAVSPKNGLTYVIDVCDDGEFDISRSDSDLIGGKSVATFASLIEAKDKCNGIESKLLS